jgi:hypothetical protein
MLMVSEPPETMVSAAFEVNVPFLGTKISWGLAGINASSRSCPTPIHLEAA